MDLADVRRLRVAVEELRDWEVSRALGADLETDDEPPKLPLEELLKRYEARHGSALSLPGDRLVSADGSTVVMLVQTSSDASGLGPDRALLEKVREHAAALHFPDAYAPDMRLGFAGDVPTRVEEMEGLMVDLGISGLIVVLLTLGAVVVFFRTWWALLILGIPLACGAVYTFGLVALPPLSIRHLNSNTAFLGSIVVGYGINSGIILFARFREERSDLQTAISTALSSTWRPTLAASVAAAASYASLVSTDFRGFRQFGWIGGIGMMVCWAANMLLIPPLLSLWGPRMAPRKPAAARLRKAALGHPGVVLAASALLLAVAALGIARRAGDWLEYDLSKLRRADSWVDGERYWGKRMDAALGRYLTPTLVLAHDAAHAQAIEERILAQANDGRAGGLIASVKSARDVLPPERGAALAEARKLNEALTPNLRKRLPERERQLVDRALSAQSLELLDADDVPDALVAGLRERDGRIDRAVLVFPKLSEGTWDAVRMHAYAEDLRAAAQMDTQRAEVAGSLLLSSDIASAIVADGPRTTLVSFFAVLIVCLLSFRALGLSLAAVASLLAGVTLMLGSLAWAGQRFHFSNFVALPITFGIAADYSINMLKRYQSEGRLRLDAALAATGGAVTLCSVTTVIGFGSLLLAQNRALFSFGVFAVTGELTCLATAIITLPAALQLALTASAAASRSPRRSHR
jgi:predicted exporter